MARKCDICGKKVQVGYNVSHAKNRTKKRWYPNLSKMKMLIDGTIKSLKICTSCQKMPNIKKVI